MKKAIQIITLIFTLLLVSCGADDSVNQECFTCENTLTEYCISQGDDFYTVSVNGATETTVPLNGAYWSDVRAQLEEECANSPTMDCFTCNDTNTQYCYLDGADFYTISVNNTTPTQTELGDLTWQEIKANLQAQCADSPATDCYTCSSTNTEYCFTEGNTFYTTTVNGQETQTDLNGQTWEEIKTELENNCPTNQTTSIVGTWTVTELYGTDVVTSNGITISNTVITGNQFDNYQLIFTENPNELTSNGSYNLHIETTSNGNTTVQDSTVVTDPNIVQTWTQNGNNLIISPPETPNITYDQYDCTILELTDSSLKLKYDIIANASGFINTYELYITCER